MAKQFNALDAETKRLQDAAGPLILAVNERVAWAEVLEELGAKLPPRFIWVTEIKALSGGKPYVQGAAPASSSPPTANGRFKIARPSTATPLAIG